MEIHTRESVWDAVADDPVEAANLKLRSQLMDALESYIGREEITQTEAAMRFGVPRSRVSELVNGRISKFTIDKLVNMASRVGLTTRITVERSARPRSVLDAANARVGLENAKKRRRVARTTRFALIAAVDWSAKSSPSPLREAADSVWIAWKRMGCEPQPKYFRTRSDAVAHLESLLDETEGPSLLAFDFPFGYPFGSGMAAKRDLYAEIARRINDEDDNSNNRFDVAAKLNAELNAGRPGPFWGCPQNRERPTLTAKADNRRGGPFVERRLADERLAGRGIQTCWKLYTRGAVGSQMLLGLPVLHRLLQRPDARLWPFETGWDRKLDGTVLAEMWPTLFHVAYDVHPIKDACQVLSSVRWMDEHIPDGLARPASIDCDEEARVMAGEGWILGLDAC